MLETVVVASENMVLDARARAPVGFWGARSRTQHSWFLMVLGVKLSLHAHSDVQSISDTFGEAGEKNVTLLWLCPVKFKKKQCQ